MHSRRFGLIVIASFVVSLSAALAGCGPTIDARKSRRTQVAPAAADTLEGTRQALEGAWTLASLELVNPQGARTQVKASGQLTYDAFGTMSVRAIVDDPALRDTLTLNFEGRIVIDTTRHEFRPVDVVADRPVDAGSIAPFAADTPRRYQIAGDSFVVTYLDASSQPSAVASWRRVPR